MIGRDIEFESAESRPIIIHWLSRGILILSVALLCAALLTLYASLRQLTQSKSVFSVKPVGSSFEVKTFGSTLEAANEARRLSQVQSNATGAMKSSGK